MVQGRVWPERNPSSRGTQQHSILVTECERSGPCLPTVGDIGAGTDTGQYRSQPPVAHQPVERASKLRMIASGYPGRHRLVTAN